jgi:hypothetical protein
VQGNRVYESIVPGEAGIIAEYDGKLFSFASEDAVCIIIIFIIIIVVIIIVFIFIIIGIILIALSSPSLL